MVLKGYFGKLYLSAKEADTFCKNVQKAQECAAAQKYFFFFKKETEVFGNCNLFGNKTENINFSNEKYNILKTKLLHFQKCYIC